MERSMGAKTVPPMAWVQVVLELSILKQEITLPVNWALPKMVTRSYGALPTLWINVSLCLQIGSHGLQLTWDP
jgi:hypothetical protein